jgi:hypothetical protein
MEYMVGIVSNCALAIEGVAKKAIIAADKDLRDEIKFSIFPPSFICIIPLYTFCYKMQEIN